LQSNGNHWVFFKLKVTLTNINNHDEGKWLVFDSLNDSKYVKELKLHINKIEKVVNSEITGRIEAYSVNMQQQNGINDCGLFAIACAFELANNKNPAEIMFDQSKMRDHFDECINENIITSFPQSDRKAKLIYTLLKMNRK